MALDEQQEEDMVFTDRGINFIIEKTLFDEVKPICVDFVESPQGGGFKLMSSLAPGSSCGDSCGC
ncbi:MAG: hypothetical protein JW925_00200 [Syntrophaceae bacterium]|nr:hypothetical protein [Syntrophaceae bacterium]